MTVRNTPKKNGMPEESPSRLTMSVTETIGPTSGSEAPRETATSTIGPRHRRRRTSRPEGGTLTARVLRTFDTFVLSTPFTDSMTGSGPWPASTQIRLTPTAPSMLLDSRSSLPPCQVECFYITGSRQTARGLCCMALRAAISARNRLTNGPKKSTHTSCC